MIKTPLLAALAFLFTSSLVASGPIEAVRQADDARVAATLAGDAATLAALYSDDLHYAHSTGGVFDKAGMIDAVVTGKTKYLSIDYETRDFKALTPEIVIMTGRSHVKTTNNGGPIDPHYLSFLGIWRLEHGAWKFVDWQSCRVATP